MPSNPLTNRAQQLILDNIPSILQLEILLFLYEARPKIFKLREMVRPLSIESAPLANQLAQLERRNLVIKQTASEASYTYATGLAERDAAMQELSDAYRSHRVSVISLIYTRPADSIRAFADAFRLRPEEKEQSQ